MVEQNFLICLVGLPASGKSTFANTLKIALKKKFNNLNVKIIDPDKIRHNLTPDKFDHEKEHIIRKENLKVIRSELEKEYIVISDDLNYYNSMRHDLKEITENLNLHFFMVHIATPIETCLKWNENRGKPIPNMVINKINERFDEFNKYKWDIPDVVYDLSQITDLNHKIKDFLAIIQKKREFMKSKLKTVAINNILSNLDNESLDKFSRIYISALLRDSTYLPFKKRIIKLRKNYVRENKNKALTESEISKTFKDYLEKNLNIKITENL
ncbi:MAG: adenylyl-sulfate kinase [Candidatus Lokiarchaeota archaeon]|nr:adenylyl-sulfate kinase [Candidatus Lokiarchaeota archaeon]